MRLALIGAALAGLAAVACGGHDGMTVSCPQNLPAACPSPAPTFAADVKPIFDSICTTCHSPTGQMATVPFTTYEQIYGRRTTVLNQVYDCVMPPANGPPITGEQRSTLMAWLVCGAPNN